MKNFIVLCFVALSATAFAQERCYYNRDGLLVPGPEGAFLYRTTEPQGQLYLVRAYYVSNGQLKLEATASETTPNIKYEGKYKSYHENGQLEDDGEYKDNKSYGLWKSYHENGQQAGEKFSDGDKTTYSQCWDESGVPLLVNGAGTFKRKLARNGEYQHYEIMNAEMIASYHIESNDSIYSMVQEIAEYRGGIEGLYRGFTKNLRYPADARRWGIEGKVFIEFTVDKEGRVHDARCLKGIGGGCDEEGVRVISEMNKWTPAKVKGKPVIQRMVLPISFKLAR